MADPLEPACADADLARYVARLRADPQPPARRLGPDGLRAAGRQRAAARPPGPRLAEVRDLAVGDPPVPARWYRPLDGPLPVLVYCHGGGWTFGDLDSHDRICRRLARAAGAAVLAVGYRLAPEHPWPAAVQDALSVLRWARERGRTAGAPGPVGIGGDSAGGNIAALCCLWLRDAGEPQPALQALAYPNTDLTLSRPSVTGKATGWGLDADEARWFAEQWVAEPAARAHPRVSPLHEPDLAGLAPAVVVTAEHDVLRDEGDAYAAALAAAGVPVRHRREPGLLHGFLGLDTVSPAAAAAGERFFADVGRLLAAAR